MLGHTADINSLSGMFIVLNFLNQNSNLNLAHWIGIEEEACEVLHLEHSFIWC
jgi:hypothetical protein